MGLRLDREECLELCLEDEGDDECLEVGVRLLEEGDDCLELCLDEGAGDECLEV